jgi:hypothetical protein
VPVLLMDLPGAFLYIWICAEGKLALASSFHSLAHLFIRSSKQCLSAYCVPDGAACSPDSDKKADAVLIVSELRLRGRGSSRQHVGHFSRKQGRGCRGSGRIKLTGSGEL